jgi:3-hydroxyacyl-[acyl-carrier-protein] dehydratase
VTGLNSSQIKEILPHRYPFLLVDRIIELEEGRRAVGIKAVTMNEPYFVGHFPDYPVMPGVLIVEALAQVGAIAVLLASDAPGRIPFLAGVDNVRFRRQVVPGDVLRLEVTLDRLRRASGRAHGLATVDGVVAVEGDILFVVRSIAERS